MEAETFDIVKIKQGGRKNIGDRVAKETPLTIFLNGHKYATLFCTSDKPKYLAIGFLHSEGLLVDKDDIKSVRVSSERSVVRVNTKSKRAPVEGVTLKRFTSGSGKGASWYYTQESTQAEDYQKVNAKIKISAKAISNLIKAFQRGSKLFATTGGVHCAALCDVKKIILLNEDVGRHNAIDKTFGEAMLKGIPTNDKILLTSGRVSSEMLAKAAKEGVPIMASISAPTDLAISLARSLGITLIGFARGEEMNVYSGEGRIERGG